MNGYLWPKFKKQRKELHALELEDCDFISEDEEKTRRINGRRHVCPRCGEVTYIQAEDPYCTSCNWDSLEDQNYRQTG